MNANNTELIDIILASNDGKAAGAIALAGNFPVDASEKALKTLVHDIASKMAVKANDPEEMELLLDVIEAGEHDDYLSDPDALLSREAIEEGEEILAHVYGSLTRARTVARSLRRPHGMSEANMEGMMSLAATLCVASLVRRGQKTYLAATDTGGVASTFWDELIKAIIKGITHVPAKRRRRRNRATYANSYKKSRKRTPQRRKTRRKKTPGLADIFGELLKRAI